MFRDTRNGVGKTVNYEIVKDVLKNAGRSDDGTERFAFSGEVPYIIKKTTEQLLGTISEWDNEINAMVEAYNNVDGVPIGNFVESIDVNGGPIIFMDETYYGGTKTITSYPSASGSFPDEYKMVENTSASISPAGYFPDGTPYYTSKVAGISYSKTGTMLKTKFEGIVPKLEGNKFLISKSSSNLKTINDRRYVDVSISYIEKIGTVNLGT